MNDPCVPTEPGISAPLGTDGSWPFEMRLTKPMFIHEVLQISDRMTADSSNYKDLLIYNSQTG